MKGFNTIYFPKLFGELLTPSTVRETILDYCKKAGVNYKGTHGFRHTPAVLLLEAGASIKFVSNRLGHKTIKTTADTYLDITEKIEEDELKKFASYTSRKFKSARMSFIILFSSCKRCRTNVHKVLTDRPFHFELD